MKRIVVTTLLTVVLLSVGTINPAGQAQSGAFIGADLYQFKPYNPFYRRYNLGMRNRLFLTDNVFGKTNQVFFEIKDGHLPLGFLESRGGLFFNSIGNSSVSVYWLDSASYNIENKESCEVPGELLFHDGLSVTEPGNKKQYGGDRDWVFSFLTLHNGEYKVYTCSSIDSLHNKVQRTSRYQPRAFYTQFNTSAPPARRYTLHILEKDDDDRFVHYTASGPFESSELLQEKQIEFARFFDAGGEVFAIYVNRVRQAWMERSGKKFQVAKHPALQDIRDIRAGVFFEDKQLKVEFYFVRLWGGFFRTGKLPMKLLTSTTIKAPVLKPAWTPPVSNFVFGYYKKEAGFFLSYGNRQQIFVPYDDISLRITDIESKISTGPKGIIADVRWGFSNPVNGKVSYSYGLTESLQFNFPAVFYRTASHKVRLYIENEGRRFFHLRAELPGALSVRDIHVPVPVYYRLPAVSLESEDRIGKGLFYFSQENISLKISGAGDTPYIYKYRLSQKQQKNITPGALNEVVDSAAGVINFRLTKPGRYFLYISSFYNNGQLFSEVKEVELWTEGNRLAERAPFQTLQEMTRQAEELSAMLEQSDGKLPSDVHKKILTRLQNLQTRMKEWRKKNKL